MITNYFKECRNIVQNSKIYYTYGSSITWDLYPLTPCCSAYTTRPLYLCNTTLSYIIEFTLNFMHISLKKFRSINDKQLSEPSTPHGKVASHPWKLKPNLWYHQPLQIRIHIPHFIQISSPSGHTVVLINLFNLHANPLAKLCRNVVHGTTYTVTEDSLEC